MENLSTEQTSTESQPKNYLPIIFFVFAAIILLFSVGGYFYLNSQRKPISIVVDTPQESSPVEIGIEDWPVFTKSKWGMTIKYPPTYTILKDLPNVVEIGVDNYSYLTITTNLETYVENNLCLSEATELPCISIGGFGQTAPVTDMIFGVRPAKSFYIDNGADNSYHVVVADGEPVVQLKAFVSRGGLEQTFQKMLTTLNFE